MIDNNVKVRTCETCKGKGKLMTAIGCTEFDCPDCKGTGVIVIQTNIIQKGGC